MAERLFHVYRAMLEGGRCKGCEYDIYVGDLIWDDGIVMYHWRCGKRANLKRNYESQQSS